MFRHDLPSPSKNLYRPLEEKNPYKSRIDVSRIWLGLRQFCLGAVRYKSVADMKNVSNTIIQICGQAEYTARNGKYHCVPNNDTRTGMFIFNLFNTETPVVLV